MRGDAEGQEPGPIDRALRVFGDVRAGEGATVLLMCLNVYLLLMAYYILKTVREPLILLAGGAELKSYAAAAQALTLIAYVPLYGWVAQRLPRQRFLAAVILFFVGCIQLFFIDTFFVRAGDMLAAGLVFLGTHVFGERVAGSARSNMLIVLLAIGVAVLMLREYRRLTTPAGAGPA